MVTSVDNGALLKLSSLDPWLCVEGGGGKTKGLVESESTAAPILLRAIFLGSEVNMEDAQGGSNIRQFQQGSINTYANVILRGFPVLSHFCEFWHVIFKK